MKDSGEQKDYISNIIGDPSIQFQKKKENSNGNDETETFFYEVYFNKEISLEFRNSENQEPSDRVVRFRIFTYKEDTILKQVKFEILDDSDLYYFIESVIDEEKFEQLKKENQLNTDLDSFLEELKFMLEDGLKTGGETQIAFIEESDGSGILKFMQALGLKSVEVLLLHFDLVDPEFVQKQVQYRFNKMKDFLDNQEAILDEFNRQMKLKSHLLLKSNKDPSKTPKKPKFVNYSHKVIKI